MGHVPVTRFGFGIILEPFLETPGFGTDLERGESFER
jgi:hypothetical protein